MTDEQQRQIARINELSAIARTSWLALIAFLAYIGITLLAVADADFFIPSRQTQLPLVGIAIPTFSFFVFAPLLATALYVYLHIHLLKLWDAIAETPPIIDGRPLGEHLHPWLVNDTMLRIRSRNAVTPRPLALLTSLVSRALVWAFGPIVIAAFWWRSMPAHDEWLTLLIALCLLVSLYAGFTNWWRGTARLRGGWSDPWQARWKKPLGVLVAVMVVVTSWLRTEGGLDHYANRLIDFAEATLGTEFFAEGNYPNGDPKPPQVVQEEWVASRWFIPHLDWFTVDADHWLAGRWLYASETWSPLARTNLAQADLVPLPADWRTPETARHAFRQSWCAREGIAMEVCDHPVTADRPLPAHVAPLRRGWCDRKSAGDDAAANHAGEACAAFFADLDTRFDTAWREERQTVVANRDRPDLAGRDLRRALATGASLVGADLQGARLEGADLRQARMEDAVLTGARLERANLRQARLEGAVLQGARLEGADLRQARLEDAVLTGARLEGADLSEAGLGGADLRQARLEGAVLRWARLEGADLSEAGLEGADLRQARLERANLFMAGLQGANLQGARLEGTNLFMAGLQGANLSAAGLEGADLSEAGLERAQLTSARLEGANLRNARLEAADLRAADLRSAYWDGADVRSPTHLADFRGAEGLSQAQLDYVIGNVGTLLPDHPAPDTGEPYRVWTCWTDPPDNLDAILEYAEPFNEDSRAALRAEWLCGPDNPRHPTGTPLALDAPYPEGHPLANRRD
jgi:uncharacterized protein YjbI with pentapeptide repeats